VRELTEHEAAYLALLRSGEIEQVDGRLRRGAAMCCLGVACESYRRITGNGEWMGDFIFKTGPLVADTAETYLHPLVSEFFGLTNLTRTGDPIMFVAPDGDPRPSTGIQWWRILTASSLNDELHWPFVQIADAFEYVFRNGKPQTVWPEDVELSTGELCSPVELHVKCLAWDGWKGYE